MDNNKRVIWVSRVLRWVLGSVIIIAGIHAGYDWYAISFGLLVVVTGFIRPQRCLGNNCCNTGIAPRRPEKP